MCKAYTLTQNSDKITEVFNLEGESNFKASYNIRPTNLVPVIIQGSQIGLSSFYWGAPPEFAQNKSLSEKLFNTKKEVLTQIVQYRNALEQRKCLIPADGFYVWRQVSKKGQIPYRYFMNDNQLFAFAGLWQEFQDLDGKTAHTFSMLTTQSNSLIATANPRMPVILTIKNGLDWLASSIDDSQGFLNNESANNLDGFTVSNRVNNPENNDVQLIKPAAPADQFGNYSLFD